MGSAFAAIQTTHETAAETAHLEMISNCSAFSFQTYIKDKTIRILNLRRLNNLLKFLK